MPISKRVQYRYDSVRNKIGMTDADGGLFTYTYDVMRRLTGVINPQGERTTYAYDLNGRRTSVQLANGTRTSYVYDLASRVQMVHTLKSDDSTVSKFEYEYDGNGRRTSVLEADGSRVTWMYDRISQVTAEWRTGTNPYRHTFTYDKVGNRTLKIEDGQRTTLVYDACNQLVTSEVNSGTTSYVYDGSGNQTVVQVPGGTRTTQVWDNENRLVKTIQPSGGVTSMSYDADGLRVKLEEPTGTKLFIWDDQNYLAETDAAGATETAFTTEPSTYGGLISHRKAGASTTYHFDALGSTRALTDESEVVLERYNYTAFGTLLGSPTLLTPFLWGGMVGYYWDAALATQYIRARHYQPAIARWISLDPIGFAGGDANMFRYVGNSPISAIDPSGMFMAPVHTRITEDVLANWSSSNAMSEGCREWIRNVVVCCSLAQDFGAGFNSLEQHYNRPFRGTDESWLTRAGAGRMADTIYRAHLSTEQDLLESQIGQSDCHKALCTMGRLAHAYQDFYAHAVRVDQGGRTMYVNVRPPNGDPNKPVRILPTGTFFLRRDTSRFNGRIGSENSIWPGFLVQRTIWGVGLKSAGMLVITGGCV